MLKWILIVGGLLVAAALIVVLIGWMLPRDHVATSAVVLRQPPDSVWPVIRDFARYPDWWPQVKTSARVADVDGREAWSQQVGPGGPLVTAVVEETPPTRAVTAIVAQEGAPFGGRWTYEVAATPGGSRVAITEDGWIANPVFRFMANVFFGMHGTMDGYLVALGRRFGEDVQPEHASGKP